MMSSVIETKPKPKTKTKIEVKSIKNISNNNSDKIHKNIVDLFAKAYDKPVGKTRRINIDKIEVRYPGLAGKQIIDIKYNKNMQQLLSFIFSNIQQKPFIQNKPNIYAFEILWAILSILDTKDMGNRNEGQMRQIREREIFSNLTLNPDVMNLIQFGKYEFKLPKYRKYIFDVSGYNLAKLMME